MNFKSLKKKYNISWKSKDWFNSVKYFWLKLYHLFKLSFVTCGIFLKMGHFDTSGSMIPRLVPEIEGGRGVQPKFSLPNRYKLEKGLRATKPPIEGMDQIFRRSTLNCYILERSWKYFLCNCMGKWTFVSHYFKRGGTIIFVIFDPHQISSSCGGPHEKDIFFLALPKITPFLFR